MTRRLCELDYAPLLEDVNGLPCMITLTMPGDWVTVAPDGEAFKKHLAAFRRRWLRRWGSNPVGVWKLEFQRRGAPHLHMLTVLPGGSGDFRRWLSEAWASVVAHPDPEQRRRHQLAGTGVDFAEGMRARDPRRLGVYFCKHGQWGSKEYQNKPPPEWACKPVGRFWGYWGLQRCTAVAEVTPHDADRAARVLRGWSHAQGGVREVSVRRVSHRSGVVRRRKVRRRVRRLGCGRGWVSLNDAPAFALELARHLTT